jgi:hypothetical protein
MDVGDSLAKVFLIADGAVEIVPRPYGSPTFDSEVDQAGRSTLPEAYDFPERSVLSLSDKNMCMVRHDTPCDQLVIRAAALYENVLQDGGASFFLEQAAPLSRILVKCDSAEQFALCLCSLFLLSGFGE